MRNEWRWLDKRKPFFETPIQSKYPFFQKDEYIFSWIWPELWSYPFIRCFEKWTMENLKFSIRYFEKARLKVEPVGWRGKRHWACSIMSHSFIPGDPMNYKGCCGLSIYEQNMARHKSALSPWAYRCISNSDRAISNTSRALALSPNPFLLSDTPIFHFTSSHFLHASTHTHYR